MLRIVLPGIATPVPALNILSIRVVNIGVVPIYVDIVVSTVPVVVVAPPTTPGRTHCHPDAK